MPDWLGRNRGPLVITLLNLVLLGGAAIYLHQPAPAPIGVTPPPPTPAPTATPTPAPLRIYVSGAVRQPDVYLLPPGSIVKDAILAAAGPTEDADCDRINQARSLQDGEHVHVPRLGETPPPTAPAASRAGQIGPVNLNTATVEQLESLPGIGPALARGIVDGRPYHTIEDLLDVSGIGPATLEKLRPLVTTGSP